MEGEEGILKEKEKEEEEEEEEEGEKEEEEEEEEEFKTKGLLYIKIIGIHKKKIDIIKI